MRISELARVIDSKPAGAFFRIKYRTEAPVTTEYKNTHSAPVYQTVEATVRTGVHYVNIGSVKAELETRTEPKKKRANNFSALIPDRIYYNQKTGKYYLYVYPTANDNRKAEYDKLVDASELKYSATKPVIKKILAENILEVF